jgi:ribonuclease P protein component
VARARIRRLLREVFRRSREILPRPLDLVLVAQGPPRPHAVYLGAFRLFGEWLTRPRKEGVRR